ncbi:MAG: nodulation protein NodZ [Synechococcaceae cyanobacterium]
MIRSLLVAIAYAKLSGRELFVDWRGGLYGYPADRNLFEDLFELIDVDQCSHPPSGSSVHPPRWSGSLDRQFADIYAEDGERPWDRKEAIAKYSSDLQELNFNEQIVVIWDFGQFSKLRIHLDRQLDIPTSLSDSAAMGVLYKRYLRLRPALQQQLDEAWGQLPQHQPLIGVHVRQTAESERARGSIRLKDYERAVAQLSGGSKSTVFLATDNRAVIEHFQKRYGQRLFTLPKWLDSAGEPLHLVNPRCPDAWDNIVAALLDLLLLARCDGLVYPSWSSFSSVSRIVGGFTSERVVPLETHQPLWQQVRSALKRRLKPGL